MPARTRVALISTYYAPVIGGAEAGASRLATYLHRRGHDVRVITKRTNLQHPERETMDGVAVWRRPPVGPRTAIGKWLWLPWAVGALSATRSEYDVIAVVDQRASGLAALVAALRRMATDTHARTHWSSAARQTGEQFGEQIVLERFAELIDSLALKRRARCT